MKQYKAVTCYVPTNLELEQINGYNKRWHEKYVWMIHSIIFSSLTTKNDFGGYVNLDSRLLLKFIGSRYYKNIIAQLVNNGIIEQNDRYSAGAFSKSFRMRGKYRKSKIKGIKIDKQTYCRKIKLAKDEYLRDVLRENANARYELMQLSYARIDLNAALDYINNNYDPRSPEYKSRWIAIEQYYRMQEVNFSNGSYHIDFTFKVNKGRIYSPATMLARDLEQFTYFLGYEDDKVVSMDMPNSQLCFFNEFVKGAKVQHIGESSRDEYRDRIDTFTGVPTPLTPSPLSAPYVFANEKPWSEYIFNGKGYERMMYLMNWKGKCYGHSKEERTEFKAEFFGQLFYNKFRKQRTEMEQTFLKYHPIEARSLRYAKKKYGNKLLAVEVQRMEAKLFHTIIVSYLRSNYIDVPFTIKHDSIAMPMSEAAHILPELNEIVRRFFKRDTIELKADVL